MLQGKIVDTQTFHLVHNYKFTIIMFYKAWILSLDNLAKSKFGILCCEIFLHLKELQLQGSEVFSIAPSWVITLYFDTWK